MDSNEYMLHLKCKTRFLFLIFSSRTYADIENKYEYVNDKFQCVVWIFRSSQHAAVIEGMVNRVFASSYLEQKIFPNFLFFEFFSPFDFPYFHKIMGSA